VTAYPRDHPITYPLAPVLDLTESSVTVLCPCCHEAHSYHAEELKPHPIRHGDRRLVQPVCIRAKNRGARDVGIIAVSWTLITIEFHRKRKAT
jgi:hypothetical protein